MALLLILGFSSSDDPDPEENLTIGSESAVESALSIHTSGKDSKVGCALAIGVSTGKESIVGCGLQMGVSMGMKMAWPGMNIMRGWGEGFDCWQNSRELTSWYSEGVVCRT
jgi:hypothetical protein